MSTPPLWMSVNVRAPGRNHPHHIRLWFPLFMLFLLAAAIIALPFILIGWLFTSEAWWWRWIVRGLPGTLRVLWSMRGLRVDVHGGGAKVFFAVY